jgi:WD40 repeat protein
MAQRAKCAALASELETVTARMEECAAQQAALAAQRAVLLQQLASAERAAEREERLQATVAIFSALSASRAPGRALCAFAGGALDTTILSTCAGTLLPFFTTKGILPLRSVCREARLAIARHPWEDLRTAIHGPRLPQWRACFPAARAACLSAAPLQPLAALPHLRGCARVNLLQQGADVVAAARAPGALPGTRLLCALTGRCEARLRRGGGTATGLAALNDCGLLVSSGEGEGDLELELWATGDCPRKAVVHGRLAGVGGELAALPGRHAHFAAAGRSSKVAAVWDAAAGGSPVCELRGHTSVVLCVAALHCAGQVATGSADATARVWDAATGACLAVLTGHTQGVYSVAAVHGGRVATGGNDHFVRVYDPAASHACTAELRMRSSVRALALCGEGGSAFLACAGLDGQVVRLEERGAGYAEAEWKGVLKGHTDGVWCLAAMPGGLLASGSSDTCIRVWAVAERACLAVLSGHTRRVRALAVLLPSGRLCSGSEGDGGNVCVWELS